MANEPKYIPNTNIPISVLDGLKDDDFESGIGF